ncbi:MAG: hypothetical protein IPJ65_24445 [Archangiaceae bacterium]|nr:hypothetical protein [Archangiaceae bacterium]
MRLLLLAVAVTFAGCSAPAACRPGSCPSGHHCVFTTSGGDPACVTACEADGGCASKACTCRPYLQGSQDCVQVCQ